MRIQEFSPSTSLHTYIQTSEQVRTYIIFLSPLYNTKGGGRGRVKEGRLYGEIYHEVQVSVQTEIEIFYDQSPIGT